MKKLMVCVMLLGLVAFSQAGLLDKSSIVATGSSAYGNDPAYAFQNAIDGDLGTRWASGGPVSSIKFDVSALLGANETMAFNSIAFAFEAALSSNFKIMTSDDGSGAIADWTEVAEVAGNSSYDITIDFATGTISGSNSGYTIATQALGSHIGLLDAGNAPAGGIVSIWETDIDGVAVAVPEPATMVLLGLGGLLLRRRK